MALIAVAVSALWLLILDRAWTAATAGDGEDRLGWRGLLSLLGALGMIQAGLAALWLAVRGAGSLAASATRRRAPAALAAGVVAGGLAVYPFLLVGGELASGDWISQQPWAWAVRLAAAAGGALGLAVLGGLDVLLQHGATSAPRRRAAFAAVLLAGSAALGWFNVTVWFGLYPGLHTAASLVAGLLALVAALSAGRWFVARAGGRLRAGASALAAALLVAGLAAWLSMDRGTRSEVLAGAATCMDAVRHLADRGPRRALVLEVLESPDRARARAEREERPPRGLLEIPADWNLVWVIGDALRADALPPNRAGGKRLARPGDTPFLDRWLEGAVRFRHAYSQAACTTRSMPPLFRSLEPNEDSATVGVPLGSYARSLGRRPIAAVPSFFVESRVEAFNLLLDGFEDVETYHEADMERELEATLALIERNREQPFLAWIHFYALHMPGWADGRILGHQDGDAQERYRRSLCWFDGQVERLMAGFEALGLGGKTVFVLGADHGQSLGEKRAVSHGANVWEETVRVPLAFRIPGRPGHLVDTAVVGNIDILPTLAELAGAPEHPTHRGRSLVPLLVDPDAPWRRDYLIRSRKEDIIGLVRGRHKLVHYADGDALYRYDVWADPNESRNLFDLAGDLDRSLLGSVLHRAPERFGVQLAQPEVRQALLRRLRDVDPRRGGDDVAFLLKLAVLEGSPEARDEVRRIYERTQELDARLELAGHAFASDAGFWSGELAGLLEAHAGTPTELDIVRRLTVQGQPGFAAKVVARRMGWWAEHGRAEDWRPWLELIRPWTGKQERHFGQPLLGMLRAAGAAMDRGADPPAETPPTEPVIDARLLELLLIDVGSLRPAKQSKLRRELARAILALADHPDPLVRAAAFRSLGRYGARGDAAEVRRVLAVPDQPLQVRQGALWAIARIEGEAAVPLIAELGEDPRLTLDAVGALREIGSRQGLPFLERVAKENFHNIHRSRAHKAAEAIRKKR